MNLVLKDNFLNERLKKMYWLRSIFDVNSKTDLELLAKIYDQIGGEIICLPPDCNEYPNFRGQDYRQFKDLLDLDLSYPLKIACMLNGPQSVRNVSIKIQKLDQKDFRHPNKTKIVIWSDKIDQMIYSEMKRKNDLGIMYNLPEDKLNDLNELFLAIRLSKHGEYALPEKDGFIVFNSKSVYLSYIGLKNNEVGTSIMFDLDDGFSYIFTDNKAEYLNEFFGQWKKSGFKGKLSEYFPKFD